MNGEHLGDCLDCTEVYQDGKGPATIQWAKRHAQRTGHKVAVEFHRTRIYRPSSPTATPDPEAKP